MWADKISDEMKIPSDFWSGEFPEGWSKPIRHTGPRGSSPLKTALIDKTQAALFAIYSGILIWSSKRLEDKTDVTKLKDLAVALFCYQHDPGYLDDSEKRPNLLTIGRQDKYEATVLYFEYAFFYDRWNNSLNWPLFPNFSMIAEVITLARHHMGQAERQVFDPWVENTVARMNILAALPEHKDFTWEIPDEEEPTQRRLTMGTPIPPQALAIDLDLEKFDLPSASADFLASVDWRTNRYLKHPDDISLVSGGVPYQAKK